MVLFLGKHKLRPPPKGKKKKKKKTERMARMIADGT